MADTEPGRLTADDQFMKLPRSLVEFASWGTEGRSHGRAGVTLASCPGKKVVRERKIRHNNGDFSVGAGQPPPVPADVSRLARPLE